MAYGRNCESDGFLTMSDGFQALSEREKETLRLLLGGHDIKSIAARLGLSVHTVNERLREARRKLGASSSRQAARILGDAEGRGPHFSGDKETGVVGATAGAANHGHSYRTPGRGHPVAWLAGGMLIMSLIIAAVVLSMLHEGDKTPAPAPARIVSAAPNTSESEGAARGWLAVVDGGGWEASFNAAGAMFRAHITAQEWASKAQPVRQPLGPVSSRVLKSVIKATELPSMPVGQYEILQFATSFAQKPDTIETVTLARESSGWKVDGYFINFGK
jgi:DNA-binding CsgD family transcriptional regulator